MYAVRDGRIEGAYANWHCDIGRFESARGYELRSRAVALQYVNSYPDPEDGSVLHVLVFRDFPPV